MSENTPEVICIGSSGARIVRVNHERLEYIDGAGQEQVIDLKECARNWVRWHDCHREEFILVPGASQADALIENTRCVGQRGALDNPPWAELMNERKTRFEFESYEALYLELLGPLGRAGWGTFDTN